MRNKLKCIRYINSLIELGYSEAYIESAAYAQYGNKVGLTFIRDYVSILEIDKNYEE